jgi:hypothetical protein
LTRRNASRIRLISEREQPAGTLRAKTKHPFF